VVVQVVDALVVRRCGTIVLASRPRVVLVVRRRQRPLERLLVKVRRLPRRRTRIS
jgi:hypothetical protein